MQRILSGEGRGLCRSKGSCDIQALWALLGRRVLSANEKEKSIKDEIHIASSSQESVDFFKSPLEELLCCGYN